MMPGEVALGLAVDVLVGLLVVRARRVRVERRARDAKIRERLRLDRSER